MDNRKDTSVIFASDQMKEPVASEFIPKYGTPAPVAYQIVKDETFPQTQPRLNLATFVTTYMDDYGTKLMNEAVGINYIDETEYPRVAVMCGRCINRIIGSMYAWRCSSMAAMARTSQGCWKAL